MHMAVYVHGYIRQSSIHSHTCLSLYENRFPEMPFVIFLSLHIDGDHAVRWKQATISYFVSLGGT